MPNKKSLADWLAPFLSEPIATPNETLLIRGLSLNSREIQAHDAFVALSGQTADGFRYIDEAVQRGASLILLDESAAEVNTVVPVLRIANLKQRLGAIASRFYGNPSAHLSLIAITGTSGKTSVSQLLAQAWWLLNKPCATIGTLGMGLKEPHYEGGLTTPDAITLQKNLAQFLSQGAEYVAMEASSHALDQGRLNALKIDTAVFTNLTQDHLDYHPSLEHYASTKARLFQWPELNLAIINDDDDYSTLLKRVSTATDIITYGLEKKAKTQIYPLTLRCHSRGMEAEVQTPWGMVSVTSTLLGSHNLCNLLVVIAHLGKKGVPLKSIEAILPQLKPIAGRLERCHTTEHQPAVFVDFAHKPDAVKKTVQTLKAICQGRLWCVIGCGGNRDALKRPLMAQAACAADVVILSSDNPRNEEPRAIIADMEPGMIPGVESHIIVSRREAIEYALHHAKANDMVLIAGRGDETHQIVKGEKIPFKDADVVQEILKQRE